jgi:hypothetical protein
VTCNPRTPLPGFMPSWKQKLLFLQPENFFVSSCMVSPPPRLAHGMQSCGSLLLLLAALHTIEQPLCAREGNFIRFCDWSPSPTHSHHFAGLKWKSFFTGGGGGAGSLKWKAVPDSLFKAGKVGRPAVQIILPVSCCSSSSLSAAALLYLTSQRGGTVTVSMWAP